MKVSKYHSIKMLLNLVAFFKLVLVMVFNHLGLFKPSEDVTNSTEDQHSTSYVIVLDHLCPLIVPVHVLTAHIKKLPVVKFNQVVTRYKLANEDDGEAIVCNICLDCIEISHEVREQRNCDHVFHRECLDSWVDQSQVTCPLCRSMLFPSKTSMDDVRSLL